MFSGCEKCYETPCGCGYEYRYWTIELLQEHITMLQRLLNEKTGETAANQETNLQIGDWVRFKCVEVGMVTEIDGEYALVSNMEREYKIRLTDCKLVYRRQDRLPLTWE